MRCVPSSMRIWTRARRAYKTRGALGPRAYTVLPLSAQNFCTQEQILELLERHAGEDGAVDTVYVESEGQKVPIVHESEFRLAAALASIYHNSLIEESVQRELDVYRQPYSMFQDGYDELDRVELLDTLHSPSVDLAEHARVEQKPVEDLPSAEAEWDAEMHGERTVYDASYEMNEDLVPWKLYDDLEIEERFGMYTY